MHIDTLVIAVVVLAATTEAQEWELWPGSTQFTSRGNLGVNAGETLQGVHNSAWCGIGDNGTKCIITGFRANLQDQNAATVESYHLVFRTGTDVAGPTPGPGGQITVVGPFASPPGGPGVQTWVATHKFSPLAVVPCDKFWAFGLRLPPSPNWSMDGLSTHMSRGDGVFARAVQCARIPPSGNHDHAWQILSGAAAASHPNKHRSWRYRCVSNQSAILQMGNNTAFTMFGQGGMYPSRASGCAFVARTRWPTTMAKGTSTLWVGFRRLSPGILLPGIRNRLRIDLGLTQIGSASIGPSVACQGAQALHVILGSIPASIPSFRAHFQAVAVTGGVAMLTNVATTQF